MAEPTNTVVQLYDMDGQPAGLYLTTRNDTHNFQNDFDIVFQEASELEEQQQEIDPDWDLRTYVDEKLADAYDLYRVWAEHVTTEII